MTISTTTLKNAARAIECDLWTDPDGANYLAKDGAILRRWEPETSSADSFELMVSLNINVDAFDRFEQVHADGWDGVEPVVLEYTYNRSQDYRTAILLLASQIGAAL
jgi:hypothetical protein